MSTPLPGIRRVVAATPSLRPGDVQGNVEAMIAVATGACSDADLVVFPELCVSGATCGDLFRQKRLQDECSSWIAEFLDATKDLRGVFVFGAPFRVAGRLFNAAYVAQGGRILGIVPKQSLSQTERRWFSAGEPAVGFVPALFADSVPFGASLVFEDEEDSSFTFSVSVGTPDQATGNAVLSCHPCALPSVADAPVPPAASAAERSRRRTCACVLANAGCGESSSEAVYAGDTAIAFDGVLLAQGERYAPQGATASALVDLAALEYRRMGASAPCPCPDSATTVVTFRAPARELDDDATAFDPHPFVPADPALRDARCAEVFAIQSNALATRLRNTGIRNVVLGLSGGLDSTLALLVCHRAFEIAGLPFDGIHLFTMPGFGTGARTRTNADDLAESLGLTLEEISIVDACAQHLHDIGHDGVTHDAAYENAQARERTQILMDEANRCGGLVVGTGDLSELALGWCTFGGDQLSMYAVNADVPKTLIQAVVSWYADQTENDSLADALRSVVATPISPELLPADANGDIAQKTEDVVGPYELHDFFLYHVLRNGAAPDKIRALALCAFEGVYNETTVDRWLHTFLRRFFSQQFKRIASAEGPRVLSVSLDPREGWRMPGDVRATAWLD